MLATELVSPLQEPTREQPAAVVHHHDLVKEAGYLEIVPLVVCEGRFELRQGIGPDGRDTEPAFPHGFV